MFRKPKEEKNLDRALAILVTRIETADEDETARLVDQITKLYKAKELFARKPISRDTLVLVAGNLIGIILILNYEKAGVVTSRALNFVMKLR